MGAILFLVLAINSNASRTVHRAPVIQAVKQTVQLIKKVYRDVMTAQLLTRVTDSSRCEEHIINSLQLCEKHVQTVKTEDSMKSIGESQCMMSGSTKTSDQCLPIGRWPDRKPKLPDLMTYSGASDDTINITRARGLIAAAAHEVERNPN
jgi:hypothetical protein